MSNKPTQRPIDLLRNANRYKKRFEELEIPLDGDARLTVIIDAPGIMDMMEEQTIIYQQKLAECEARGLHQYQVSESEWQKELANYEDSNTRAQMEKRKPANAAEFVASQISKFATIQTLLPMYLKDKETGQKICQNAEDVEFFKQVFSADQNLFQDALKKYTNLIAASAGEAAKNSSAPKAPSGAVGSYK